MKTAFFFPTEFPLGNLVLVNLVDDVEVEFPMEFPSLDQLKRAAAAADDDDLLTPIFEYRKITPANLPGSLRWL